MKTKEIIDMLINRSDMLHRDQDSRTVMSFSILKQGSGHLHIENVVNQMETALVGTSTDVEYITGWHSGWHVSDDHEIICYAYIDLETDMEMVMEKCNPKN